jgi:hypothetical protein
MRSLHAFCLSALFFATAVLVAGCDGFESGTPPDELTDDPGTAVSFAEGGFSAVESSGTVSIDVQINNPPGGREVVAEVLYADDTSSTSAADFNLPPSAAVSQPADEANGFVAGAVTFPPDAEDGDVETIELNIQDDDDGEDRETGFFFLQQVQNATVGSPSNLSITIGAITVLSEDFSDEELAPFTAVSVASNENWELGNPPVDNAPLAVANGFGGNEPANDWLISPAFNFNQLQDESLTFDNSKGFDDGGLRGLQVKVSPDYDGESNPENEEFTWINVSDQVTFAQTSQQEGNFTPFIASGDIDLSADSLQSDETYIAFQYRSSGTGPGEAAAWQVDNILLRSSTPPEESGTEQ